MKQITLKSARHKCSVPPCKNTETFIISGSPNSFGGFFLCRDCIANIARLSGVSSKKKAVNNKND